MLERSQGKVRAVVCEDARVKRNSVHGEVEWWEKRVLKY